LLRLHVNPFDYTILGMLTVAGFFTSSKELAKASPLRRDQPSAEEA
jgi:hypothetical protein